MKKENITLVLILLLAQLVYQCKSDTKQDLSNISKAYSDKNTEQKKDTIDVHFNNSIILTWDNINNQFVKNNEYNSILRSNNKMKLLVENIKNNEDLKIQVCTKTKSNLKKGDIAFLFLYKEQKIFIFSCLKVQFDNIDKCYIPSELLDFIEDNRIKVAEQVKICFKN